MKKIFKIFGLAAIAALTVTSCTEEDNVIDQVFDGVTNGAVLRTLTEPPIVDRVILDVEPALFAVRIEEQDNQNGALLESVDVYATFTDESSVAGDTSGGTVDTEVFVRNVPASAFETGDFGFPVHQLDIQLTELLTLTNLTNNDIYVNDTFTIRLSLNLTDGRVFSVDNAGGIITGGFFNSPFQYILTVGGGMELSFSEEGPNEINLAEGFPNEGYSADVTVTEEVSELFTSMEIFARFVDNTVMDGDDDISTEEMSIGTFARDLFTATEEDPLAIVSSIALDLATISGGVDINDMAVGDEVLLRYELTNNQGRVITSNMEPFVISVPVVVCEVPDPPKGFFSGMYEFSQEGVGPFDDGFGQFYGTQTVEVVVDKVDPNIRTFDFLILPESLASDYTGTITLSCGNVLYFNETAAGVLCVQGAGAILDANSVPPAEFDPEGSDDIVEVGISVGAVNTGDCGGHPYDIVLTFEKQE